MIDYKNTVALAPMVRVSDLPLRSLCLKYGADLVWGPEVIDKAIIGSKRSVNAKLGTVDFFSLKDPTRLIWRTAPSLEKHKLVFQLGSANAELAVQAGQMVAGDVSAIDLNCGCPKHFSVHAGMGAQLLAVPDKLVEILSSLVEQVGKPHDIAISAKIRLLETAEKTYELVSRLVKTGIACLTVHCRTTPMRPREPARYEYLQRVAEICHANGVHCLVNGDVRSREELPKFVEKYGVDGVMIARAAQVSPACFSSTVQLTPLQVCREFLDACVKFDYNTAHAKYNLTSYVPGKDSLYMQFSRAKSLVELEGHIKQREEEMRQYRKRRPELTNSTVSAAQTEVAARTEGNENGVDDAPPLKKYKRELAT